MNPIFTTGIVVITVIISLLAFSNQTLRQKLIFWPYYVWRNNEWYRLLTCGLVHADMGHLFFNMFALYSFGGFIEPEFQDIFGSKGTFLYLAMYILAIMTADIYNLIKRKDDYNYRSLGASGGVSAVVFASILINPYGGISIMFLPSIPAFIFGPIYLLYCAYMAKRGGDNVGHIAHFTGSVFGFFFPVIFKPELLLNFVQLLSVGHSIN